MTFNIFTHESCVWETQKETFKLCREYLSLGLVFFFGFVFGLFSLLRYFDVIYGCLFFRDCSRQWGVTNQAGLRKANGNFCRALLIAVKAPRQIQYRHGYIYVSMQISSYICVRWERDRRGMPAREREGDGARASLSH